jgi:hypothetical protein
VPKGNPFYFFNSKCFSASSAIYPPIARDAVAAGEGAFKT